MTADSPAQLNACETDHTPPILLKFYDRMMLEVETFVETKWTSVAINDRYNMERLPDDHVAIWIVKPEGSHFIRPYCSLVHRNCIVGSEGAQGAFSAFEAFFVRCQDYFIKFRSKYDPTKNKYFVVIKRHDGWSGELIPTTFAELLDLAFVGRLKWSDCGMCENHCSKALEAWERDWLGLEA